MKSWLFALGLALCCVVQANEKKQCEDVDFSKMPGCKIMGAVATDCSEVNKMASGMKASYVCFAMKSPENLKMTMQMAMPRVGCQTIKADIMNKDGFVSSTCENGVKKIMDCQQTKGNSTFNIIKVLGEKPCKVITHMGKSFADIETNSKAFETFVKEGGLENIHDLPTEGMCPPPS